MPKNISPHVSIYKFPITAVSSIATRISGFYMTGLYVVSGTAYLFGIDPFKRYDELSNLNKTIANYSIITPSVYHSFGGIRHFIWDKYPSLLNNAQVGRSSFFIFGATAVCSFLIENRLKKWINKLFIRYI